MEEIPGEAMDGALNVSAQASYHYLNNPEFHARVEIASEITQMVARENGIPMDKTAIASAVQAAAVALTLMNVNVMEMMSEEEVAMTALGMMEAQLNVESILRGMEDK